MNKNKTVVRLCKLMNDFLIFEKYSNISNGHWIKDFGWKKNDITVKKPYATFNDIDVHFMVILCPPKTEIYLDQTNVGRLVGLKDCFFKPPLFSIFEKTFIASVLKAVEKSFSWFDDYSTPQKCLPFLKNRFAGDIKKYKKYEKYLKRIKL